MTIFSIDFQLFKAQFSLIVHKIIGTYIIRVGVPTFLSILLLDKNVYPISEKSNNFL